jgi:hypothetical protein
VMCVLIQVSLSDDDKIEYEVEGTVKLTFIALKASYTSSLRPHR